MRPLAMVLLLVSCTFSRTQTVVEIRADRAITAQATEVRVEVRDHARQIVFDRTIGIATSDFRGFPIEIPVSAKRGEDTRSFELSVQAIQSRRQEDGSTVLTPLAQNRLRTSFRRGEVLRVSLWLLSGCRCDVETERCEPDADADLVPECVPLDVVTPTLDAGVEDAARDVLLSDVSDGGPLDAALCNAQQRLCDGRCVARTSPLFCGPSCSACVAVSGATLSCENDTCVATCAVSTPDRCTGGCVDFATDRQNCGACSRICPEGQLCQNRLCIEPPQCDPANDSCPGLSYCDAETRRCVAGCNGRPGQCAAERMCNLNDHTCICRSDLTACGGACAQCPTGASVSSTGCEGTSCLVVACATGYRSNTNRTACVAIPEPTWTSLGSSLSAMPAYDALSPALALAPDGAIALAFLQQLGANPNSSPRAVHVYRYQNDTWSALGTPLEGTVYNPALTIWNGDPVISFFVWSGVNDYAIRTYRFRGGWSQMGSGILHNTLLLQTSLVLHDGSPWFGVSEYTTLTDPSRGVLYEFSSGNFVRRAVVDGVEGDSVIPSLFTVAGDLFVASSDGDRARVRRYVAGTLVAHGSNNGAASLANDAVAGFSVIGVARQQTTPMVAFSVLDSGGSSSVSIAAFANNRWDTWPMSISPATGTRTFATARAAEADGRGGVHLLIQANALDQDPFLQLYRCVVATQSCTMVADRIGPVNASQSTMILDATGQPVIAWTQANASIKRIQVVRLQS